MLQGVGTLLVLLALLEIWARLFPPKDQIVWPLTQRPLIGTTFVPNSAVVLSNGLDYHVETLANEAGFLDRPLPPVEKAPGSCRIAVVGDSFVEAAQVPIEQKLQVQLERMAKARWPGRTFETMAVGFSGTGQINQIPYFDTFLRARRPDVVVLVFVSNDFANNSSLLEALRVGWHPAHTPRLFAQERDNGQIELLAIDPDWQAKRLPQSADARPRPHRWLMRVSRFYRWLYAKVALLYPNVAAAIGREPTSAERTATRLAALVAIDPGFKRAFGSWDPGRDPGLDAIFRQRAELPPAFEQALRFTSFAFDAYKGRALEDGFQIVVVATHEVSELTEDRLRRMVADKDIPLLSLKDYIVRRGGQPDQAQWPHDGHWNPQGHRWVAEMVLEHLGKHKPCGLP